MVGSVPSGGKSTRCGPTAPMCRIRRRRAGTAVEDEHHRAGGIVARRDVGDREDLGRRLLLLAQDGPHACRRVLDRLASPSPRSCRLRACGRLVVGLLLVVAVLRVVAHGRAGYPLFSAAERGQLRMTRCAGRGKLGAREGGGTDDADCCRESRCQARRRPDAGSRIDVLRSDGRALGIVRDAARGVAGDARRSL